MTVEGPNGRYLPEAPKTDRTSYISIRREDGSYQRVECKHVLNAASKMADILRVYFFIEPVWTKVDVRTREGGKDVIREVFLKKSATFIPITGNLYFAHREEAVAERVEAAAAPIFAHVRAERPLHSSISTSRKAEPSDHPQLLSIARERMGAAREELMIEPGDVRRFVAWQAEHYREATSVKSWSSNAQKQISEYREKGPSQEGIVRNLGNFCGLDGVVENLDGEEIELEGGVALETLIEMEGALDDFSFLEKGESIEFQEAFRKDASQVPDREMIQRIRQGKLTTFTLSYSYNKGGHGISLVFYKGKFAICNRGFGGGDGVIRIFAYDESKLNLDALLFLLDSSLRWDRSIEKMGRDIGTDLYETFPLILRAREIGGSPDTPIVLSSRPQKVGNCAKASPMTAFKVGVFLKELETRPLDVPEAIWERRAASKAKKVSSALSYKLRLKAIKSALRLADSSTDPLFKGTLKAACKNGLKKMGKGVLGRVLSESDAEKMCEEARRESDRYSEREIVQNDDDLLLFIAAERRRLGDLWRPSSLLEYSLDKKMYRSRIELFKQDNPGFKIPPFDLALIQKIRDKLNS